MAGGSLLKHRDSIANTTVDDDVKSLDPMKVFVAGKVMAAVAFMSLNLSPWCLTAISPRRQLWLRAEEYKRMMGDYSFAVSCIFACVDCLSRQPRTTPLLCHLLTIITILFNHFSVTAKIEGASPPFNRIAAEVSTTFTPILIRCLRRQVDSNTDSTDQIMLRLIFSALRGMSTFRGVWLKNQELSRSSVAAVITNISSRGSPASSTGGDFFDDLDDSIFASLEMEGALPGGQPAGDAKSEAKPYWAIMLEILVALKVRLRATLGKRESFDNYEAYCYRFVSFPFLSSLPIASKS